MVRGIAVLWVMAWHFVINTFKRHKYSLKNKTLDAKAKKAHRTETFKMMETLCSGMLRAAGTTLEIRGEENLPKEGPVVYMATHKGLFDSPIMAHIVNEPVIFIGKEETKKMPIISKWFDAMGCIYLARDDMKKSLQAILDGIKELKEGQSIVIFPEGTRSRGEEMGEFKAGSFKLATKANVPIVPIAIQNSHKILEEKGRIEKTVVYVNIGPVINVPEMSSEEKKVLPKIVEGKVRELLEEITL